MFILNVLCAVFSISFAIVVGLRTGWYFCDNFDAFVYVLHWLWRHTLGRFFRKKP